MIPLLLACRCATPEGEVYDSYEDAWRDSPAPCPHFLIDPPDGADGHFYETPVRIRSYEWDSDVDVSVDGVRGTSTHEHWAPGEIVTFTPASPFTPEISYTARIANPCDDITADFTTSAAGLPLETELAGRTYRFDYGTGTYHPGLIEAHQAVLEVECVLAMEVVSVSDELELLVAPMVSGEPDPCSAQTWVATWDEPKAMVVPEDPGALCPDIDAGTSWTFTPTPDGTYLEGIRLEGRVDMRSVVGEPELQDCETVQTHAWGPCVACSDGVETCVEIYLEDARATGQGEPIGDPEGC